jgi:hypothetical protein
MNGLDPALLIGLMSGNAGDAQARIQQLLLQSLAGDAGDEPARGNADEALRRLQKELSFIETEFRHVSTLLAQIGEALGACQRCLGTDEECPVCVGAGSPGSEYPNAERFNALIAPAVRRLAEEVGAVNSG